ncbi:probable serine/threonine-protein kinase PBL10 [Salvia hispanica]|uniref:probable serine/threonine-protein kinase PBL10 n=1 Tax=Salvia hispanica TaxID=49212 RepID=UPI0020099422|nr:probable serine/threonine-protein kinase PBL10 [Salvia hispanica]
MGRVFRAWIDEHTLIASNPGSGMAVAVRDFVQRRDWLKKIDYLVQLSHPNLVSFVGYCTEENSMMLVFEFMPNGSLRDHLFTNPQLHVVSELPVVLLPPQRVDFPERLGGDELDL